MSWAERKLNDLAQKETDKGEQDRADLERSARVRTDAPLLWDALKQMIRANIGEFNTKSKSHYFTIKNPASFDAECHLIESPKGHVWLRYYRETPKLVIEEYAARADSIEALRQNTWEFSFEMREGRVSFVERGTAITVSELAERCLDCLV